MQILYDMDQVLLDDGRIIRVMGNFDNGTQFFGFPVYSPDSSGDRVFRGTRYSKYKSESTYSVDSVLDTCEIIEKARITEFFDPIETAKSNNNSYAGTIWHDLYIKLVSIFGENNVGLLGSALSGLHFNLEGKLKNDVDFFIEGIDKVTILEKNMQSVREYLGFCDYEPDILKVIYDECSEVYSNPNNTLRKIIERRWSGMELPGDLPVRNTMRFRDKNIESPFGLLSKKSLEENRKVRGIVSQAIGGNLFPRHFSITTSQGDVHDIYCMWWKISSPVKDGDEVEVCGDILNMNGNEAVRIANFENHWIHIYN